MTLHNLPKPSLEEFIATCTPLAIFDSLEIEMREQVDRITQALTEHQIGHDPAQNLVDFLKADRAFLGVLLALTNLSQEKFLRILSAECSVAKMAKA